MKLNTAISVLCLLAVLSQFSVQIEGKLIFCYYSSFAQRRHGLGHFLPEDIDPHLCTHLIYAFVDITEDGTDLKPFNRNDPGPQGLYARTLALKEQNPKLKVLLAVGGWKIGSKPFLPMISDDDNIKVWTENVVCYLREHGFDGFDMDWEFPGTRGSAPEDKYRFTELMKGLHQAFAEEAARSGKEKLILTLATASGTFYIDQSYEPYKIIKYIDYMLLMTYNYHGQWEKETGHHSGLYRHWDDPTEGEESQLYTQWSIDYWLNVGMPKNRLIVGIPTYAMTYTLADPPENGIHAPAEGGGRMGEYTQERGILAYYEVCTNLRDKGWESVWIDSQAVPYAYGDDQWAGYDNVESIRLKAENILSRDLAGAFVWSVELDDFKGLCGQGKYPLMSTIQKLIGDSPVSSSAAGHADFQQELAINMKHQREKIPIDDQSDWTSKHPGVPKGFRKAKRRQKWHRPDHDDEDPEAASSEMTSASPHHGDDNNHIVVRWWKSLADGKIDGQGIWSESKPRKRMVLKGNKVWRKKSHRRKAIHANPEYQVVKEEPAKANDVDDDDDPDYDTETDEVEDSYEMDSGSSEWNYDEPINAPAAASPRASLCRKLGVGTFEDPESCDHFIMCTPGGWQGSFPLVMECPPGTRFDSELKICNFASKVECSR